MPGLERRTLMIAAALVAASAAPSFGVPTGNIHGVNEKPLLDALAVCRGLERDARTLALAEDQKAKLSASAGNAVATKINQALDCLSNLKAAIVAGGPYQDTTDSDGALNALNAAFDADGSVLNAIVNNRPASAVVASIDKADIDKDQAAGFIKARPLTKKEAKTLVDDTEDDDAWTSDAESSASKRDNRLTPGDIRDGRGDSKDAKGSVGTEHGPKVRPESAARGATVRAATAPKNHYYAFVGTTTDTGYAFKTLGRDLFGPFETRFLVGSFDFYSTYDTGSACVEFDVKGSSPLQFFAVCGRRINNGVQVFAQSDTGAQGNVFIAGTNVAQVIVTYSGTAFNVKAGPRGVPEIFFYSLPTYNLAQGETPLVAGIGASGLTKGQIVGLDDIIITAK